jgi:tRNA pseudouridine38-40 synthase
MIFDLSIKKIWVILSLPYMHNLKMILQYDGSRYLGWQRQREEDPERPRTIQGKMEQVLSRMSGERIRVIGASRTDAGVHAEAQVANFHTSSPLDAGEVLTYCARYLPSDIAVRSVEEVDPRFHARYLALRKRYLYRLWTRTYPDVFRRKFTLHVPEPLDVTAMRQAAAMLVGERDFRSFTSMKSKTKSPVRTLFALELQEGPATLELAFEGDAFLPHMIRIMTGTLLEVGGGRLDPQAVPAILEARDRGVAGPLAPAHGLCLREILY